MKKLLGIVVLGLIWCNISFAETTHQYLLKNELVVLYEGKEWKLQFQSNNKIMETWDGEVNYYAYEKINDNGKYKKYLHKKAKPKGSFNLWEIDLDNKVFKETTTNGSIYANKILSAGNNSTSSVSSEGSSTNDKIAQSKKICKELGFKANSEKFADCALKMMALQFETGNKVSNSDGSSTQKIIVQKQDDFDIGDFFFGLQKIVDDNYRSTNNNSSNQGTNCTIKPKAWGADMVCR